MATYDLGSIFGSFANRVQNRQTQPQQSMVPAGGYGNQPPPSLSAWNQLLSNPATAGQYYPEVQGWLTENVPGAKGGTYDWGSYQRMGAGGNLEYINPATGQWGTIAQAIGGIPGMASKLGTLFPSETGLMAPYMGGGGGGFAMPDFANIRGPSSTSRSSSSSYSGIGPEYKGLISGWMSNLDKQLQPEAYRGLISGAYGAARGLTGEAYGRATGDVSGAYEQARGYLPELYEQRLQPALQGALNQLAARNMLQSSVGSEALGRAATGVAAPILAEQGALSANEAAARAGLAGSYQNLISGLGQSEAEALGIYPSLLAATTQGLGTYQKSSGGTTSRSTSGDYGAQMLASIFPYLMQYGGA